MTTTTIQTTQGEARAEFDRRRVTYFAADVLTRASEDGGLSAEDVLEAAQRMGLVSDDETGSDDDAAHHPLTDLGRAIVAEMRAMEDTARAAAHPDREEHGR